MKILKGGLVNIGVAPHEVIETGMCWGNCGFYVLNLYGELYSERGDKATKPSTRAALL